MWKAKVLEGHSRTDLYEAFLTIDLGLTVLTADSIKSDQMTTSTVVPHPWLRIKRPGCP